MILRGANDYMLDEMERALHDSLSIVKRALESNTVNLALPDYFFLGVLAISKRGLNYFLVSPQANFCYVVFPDLNS